MIRIILIMSFYLISNLSSCRYMNLNHNKITGVKIISIKPIILRDGKVYNMLGFLNVYQFKNLNLYERSYHFDSSTNDELILEEYRYNYFVFQKDSLYGLGYEIPGRISPSRILVDSILKNWGYGEMRLEQVLNLPAPKSDNDEKNSVIRDWYSGGDFKNDSLILYYDKNFKNTSFSFSPKLDSIKKAKLYKIRFVNDTTSHPGYSFTLPKREFLFEMKDTVLADDSKIRNLFKRYLEGK